MQKISSKSIRVAEAIRDREDFDTHGALKGRNVRSCTAWDAGRLTGPDYEAFTVDASAIRYVVWSYATPIAWCTLSGRWHKVEQKFSMTTSHHQGRLYLIESDGSWVEG